MLVSVCMFRMWTPGRLAVLYGTTNGGPNKQTNKQTKLSCQVCQLYKPENRKLVGKLRQTLVQHPSLPSGFCGLLLQVGGTVPLKKGNCRNHISGPGERHLVGVVDINSSRCHT